MKKSLQQFFGTFHFKILVVSFFTIWNVFAVIGQVATYPLMTGGANPPGGTAAPNPATSLNVTAGALQYSVGTNMVAITYNGSGFRVKTNSIAWPVSINNTYCFDIPLRPNAGYDIHFTGITGRDSVHSYATGSTILYMEPYYQVDGAGAWRRMNGATTVGITSSPSGGFNFGAINETFYSGHTYLIRFYVYASPGSDKNDNFRLKNLVFNGTVTTPAAVAPTVTTVSAATTGNGLYAATATGTYQFGNAYYTAYAAGMVWSTNPIPTLANGTSSTNGVGGNISTNITGLTAGTTYYVAAYVTTQFGTIYGTPISFSTGAPIAPVVTTNKPTNILSNKAFGGGVIVDSGGVAIIEKGLVWKVGSTPTVLSYAPNGKLIFGGGSTPFSDWMKLLTPNTTYHVRAYARNSVGLSYGGDSIFTTLGPTPVLAAVPGFLDFGENFGGSNPLIISYQLTGANLTGAPGVITITPPAGYLISTSNAIASFGTVSAPITIPYNGTSIPSMPIYVMLPTTTFGSFCGNIIMTGGGTTPINADTVKVCGTIVQSPDNVTNSGNDFWLGFGYQEKMSKDATDPDEARMSVYVTTGNQPATVHCVGPNYNQVFTIPANNVHEFTNFPTGDPTDANNPTGLPDFRLFSTGISNKSVHVYSDNGVPVSVFLHTYTNKNSAAGAMIFPTSTWNSSYTVQAYGGTSNNSNPNSFFFVIANEDNTVVNFTPKQPILDASAASLFNSNTTTAANTAYAANPATPYTVTLNKGQVFNAMGGFGSSNNGLDLSGSTVKTTCDKKIAVFGGNGRVLVNANVANCTATQGSDHLIQQMFPTVAWGTKYLTVPTKTMEFNYFRIYVQDPLSPAVVKVNGTIIGGFNGIYYQYSSNQPLMIESDKPVNVSQFITAAGCANNNGSKGSGDPEMIILSPVQQTISNATVYSAPFRGIGASPVVNPAQPNGTIGNCGSFINVVIPTAGVASFKLDGLSVADTGTAAPAGICAGNCTAYSASTILLPMAQAFKPHPQDPSFSMAKFWAKTAAVHTLSSNYGFNAIAYGMGNGESYGYNAGTSVKNLSSIKVAVNPNGTDTSTTSIRTCRDNPVTIKIALPHNPFLVDSVVFSNTNLSAQPYGAFAVPRDGAGHAVYTGTTIVDGITFYIYSCTVPFTFSQLGSFVINATAYGTFASDCPGQDKQKIVVIVGRDNVNFDYAAACGSPNLTFTNNTTPMAGTTISSLAWNYGDGTLPLGTGNPTQAHTYSPPGTVFNVILTTQNSIGCISSDSLLVDFSGGVHAKFTVAPSDSVCAGTTVSFDPSNSNITGTTAGTANSWQWNFNDGPVPAPIAGSSIPIITHTYNNPGTYYPTLTMSTTNACSNTFRDTIVVQATPVAAFGPSVLKACFGDSVRFVDQSTIAGTIGTWDWNFGNPASGALNDSSDLQNPAHLYSSPGTYTVTLNVKTTAGCPSTNTATHTVVIDTLPTASFTFTVNCVNKSMTFTSTSDPRGGTLDSLFWNFDDGTGIHAYPATTNPITWLYPMGGSHNVTLIVKTVNGCKNSVPFTQTAAFGATPFANFSLPAGNFCLPNPAVTFTNTSTISDATLMTYTWHFGDATLDTNITIAAAPAPITHNYAVVGPFSVILTATSNQGCKDDTTIVFNTVYAKPVAAFTVSTEVCLNDSTAFTDQSTPNSGIAAVNQWFWDFGDGSPISNLQNPKHKYLTAGTYTIKLVVKSAVGCFSDTVSHTTIVNALPTAKFGKTIDCSLRKVTFSDSSISNVAGSNIVQWIWTFGDGSPNETHINPTPFIHTFPLSGVPYTVTLTVVTDKGCTSVVYSQIIFISAIPSTNFTLPGNVCLPIGAATFTNTTTISDGTLMTYIWNFGDLTHAPADTISVPAPPTTITHNYASTGPFPVKLTATSSNGCVHDTTITFSTIYMPPVAAFTPPVEVCLNDSSSFTDQSTPTTGTAAVNQWAWNFGEPGSPSNTSILQNPKHLYATADTFTVTLTVTSAVGCSSAQVTRTTIVNPLPIAGFTFVQNCNAVSVTFTNTSVANAGNITTWYWNYGDGKKDTLFNAGPVTHIYPSAGVSYTATLVVKTDKGCVSSIPFAQTFTIDVKPVANFDLPANLCLPNASATFNNTTTISDGTIAGVTYLWNFGDGTGNVPSPPNSPTHIYAGVGPFSVKLIATSNNGCIDDTTIVYNGIYAAPVAAFAAVNTEICLSDSAAFTDLSTPSTGTAAVNQWQWDFGDTFTSGLQHPKHKYINPGTYTVTLIVKSASGCFSSAVTHTIIVDTLPTADFTVAAVRCEKNNIAFTDASNGRGGNLTEWHWSFGDGTSLVQFTPALVNHIYTAAGNYMVKLWVKNSHGCISATDSLPITVNPLPVVDFAPSFFCSKPDSVVFTSLSTVPGGIDTAWHWSFGDNTTGIGNPVSHTYTVFGANSITLAVTSNNGCIDSLKKPITIVNGPTAKDSIANKNQLCSNQPVTLYNLSTVTGFGTVTKVEVFWDFPDLTNVTIDNNPAVNNSYTHQYPVFGTPDSMMKMVVVRAHNTNGCTNDTIQLIKLKASPQIQFSPLLPVCEEVKPYDLTGAFDIYSLGGNGVFLSGNGIVSSPTFSPTLAGAGTWTITYRDTAANGCFTEASQTIVVNPTPDVKFPSPFSIEPGYNITLNPTTVSGTGLTYTWTELPNNNYPPANYLDNNISPTPTALNPTHDVSYMVVVQSNPDGCIDSSIVKLNVLTDFIVPNTFTPNNDGVNDYWEIDNLAKYPSHRVQIFNRYGQMLFETRKYVHWDGTHKGKILPFGTYYYVIELGGVRVPKTGYVTIIK